MPPRLKDSDYHALASRRGFTWLGTSTTVMEKTLWRCSQGHEWLARYNDIGSKNSNCPYCTGFNIPATPDRYHALANKRGFEWLGPEVETIKDKTRWRCGSGHEWMARYNDIQQGKGCVRCYHASKTSPLTIKDYRQIGLPDNEWIGDTLPRNSMTKTLYRCTKNQHEWKSSYSNLQSGHRCPSCQDRVNGQPVSKPQRAVHEMLGGELNFRVRRYVIDIALQLDGARIAVEYDSWYWHQGKEDHDTKRNTYLFRHGWRILRIKSGQNLPSLEQLNTALALLRSGNPYTEIILDDWKD